MSSPFQDRRFALASLGILLMAGALRLPGLSRPLWLDETHSMSRAMDPTPGGMVQGALAGGHPPLYFAALRSWIAIWGPSELASRVLSLLPTFGSLAVLLGAVGARAPAAGIAAGILFATNPLLVRYASEIRGYALFIFFALVAIAAAWRLAEEPGSRPARLALLIALPSAVLTHVAGAFLLPAAAVFAAVAAPREVRMHTIRALVAPLAAGTVVFAVLAAGFAAFGPHRRDWWLPPTTSGLAARCFGSLFGFPGHPAEGHPAQFALGIAACAAMVALVFASHERAAAAFLAAAGAFWSAILLSSIFFFPSVLDRLLLPALPLLFCALALALFSRPGPRRQWASAALIAAAFLWARDARASFGRPIEDFREAASRISREFRPGDAVLVYPSFAVRALVRYLPEEPARAVRPADTREGQAAAPAVSFLIRPGLEFRRTGPALAEILEAIGSRSPRPAIRILVIEPIDAPMAPEAARYRDDVIAAARRAFGEPAEESANGLLYDARWGAASARR